MKASLCLIAIAALVTAPLRAQSAACKIDWGHIAKILRAKDANALLALTEWRGKEAPAIATEPEMLAYGARLWELGDRKSAAKLIAPRVPVDRDGWGCVNDLFEEREGMLPDAQGDPPLTEEEEARLGWVMFNLFLNPRVLFLTADADMLDRGFRVYLQGFDGEWGEALGGCSEELGEGPCTADDVHETDLCVSAAYRPAVERGLARLTARERERLRREPGFAGCFAPLTRAKPKR